MLFRLGVSCAEELTVQSYTWQLVQSFQNGFCCYSITSLLEVSLGNGTFIPSLGLRLWCISSILCQLFCCHRLERLCDGFFQLNIGILSGRAGFGWSHLPPMPVSPPPCLLPTPEHLSPKSLTPMCFSHVQDSVHLMLNNSALGQYWCSLLFVYCNCALLAVPSH